MSVPIAVFYFLLSSFLPCRNVEECGDILYQSISNYTINKAEQIQFYLTKYGAEDGQKILDHAMHKVLQSNDSEVFEVMLQAQLEVFDKKTPENLKLFARNLKQFQQNVLYDTLNKTLRSLAEDHMRRTLLQLTHNNIFQDCFSLRNNYYKSFIYTDPKQDNAETKSNRIFIRVEDVKIDDTGYVAAEVKGFDDDLRKFNVTLKGTKYNMYYIMGDRRDHPILGWESPKGHIWTVELLEDNKVLLYQNDYFMCAVDGHDEQRSNVAGRRQLTDEECQWIPEPCGVFDKKYAMDENYNDEGDDEDDGDDDSDYEGLSEDDVEQQQPFDSIDDTVY